jgi:hypothetical protein
MTDWRIDAYEEYLEKRAILVSAYNDVQRQRRHLDAVEAGIVQQVNDLDNAAQVFGLGGAEADIDSDGPTFFDAPAQDGQVGFKELAIEFVAAVFPQPARAAQVRDYVERKLKRSFHEKTAGMTLYRLSQEGIVRREGKGDWYFVPPDRRNSPAPQGKPLTGFARVAAESGLAAMDEADIAPEDQEQQMAK